MTDITELAQRMKAAAEKATPGEWWADEVKNEGCYGSGDDCVEGFTSYAIYGSDGQTLFDSLNSDAACICEEYDGEGHVAWDETAQRNAEFIALANPANILALVEALEKAQGAATQQGNIASALFDEVNQLRRHADEKAPELRALLIEADSELEALHQRITELESSGVAPGILRCTECSFRSHAQMVAGSFSLSPGKRWPSNLCSPLNRVFRICWKLRSASRNSNLICLNGQTASTMVLPTTT